LRGIRSVPSCQLTEGDPTKTCWVTCTRYPNVDVTIDGADEVDSQLNAIKGGGGAHLQEKVVAEAAKKFVIVADYRKDSKLLGEQVMVPRLSQSGLVPHPSTPQDDPRPSEGDNLAGSEFDTNEWLLFSYSIRVSCRSSQKQQWTKGVPIEAVPFAWKAVLKKLQDLGSKNANLRMAVAKAGPVVTDNGNFLIDAPFGNIHEPAQLLKDLKLITGVVEVGLFCNMAEVAYFGCEDGSVRIRTK